MADKPGQAKGGKQRGGGKGRLLLIALLLLLLLAGGAGAAWWLLLRPRQPAGAQQLAAERLRQIHFIILAPFVTNLASSDGSMHYLQTTLALRTSDGKLDARVQALTPEIRNAILRLLAAQPADKAASLQVRRQLRVQIRAQLNRLLGGRTGPAPVSGVYYTSYVVQ